MCGVVNPKALAEAVSHPFSACRSPSFRPRQRQEAPAAYLAVFVRPFLLIPSPLSAVTGPHHGQRAILEELLKSTCENCENCPGGPRPEPGALPEPRWMENGLGLLRCTSDVVETDGQTQVRLCPKLIDPSVGSAVCLPSAPLGVQGRCARGRGFASEWQGWL